MHYEKIRSAIFLRRPNRFIAEVLLDGKTETVHVKNTGRCKELLVPGCTVYLSESGNSSRKTRFDLVAAEKKIIRGEKTEFLRINMDSLAPNKICSEWIHGKNPRYKNLVSVKSEFSLGDSRFDFFVRYNDEKNQPHSQIIEVKGCTLEENSVASFPDAPTIRGLKHVTELADFAERKLYECTVLFVVQMEGCKFFTPNSANDPKFAAALKKAEEKGVEILALECSVEADSLFPRKFLPVQL